MVQAQFLVGDLHRSHSRSHNVTDSFFANNSRSKKEEMWSSFIVFVFSGSIDRNAAWSWVIMWPWPWVKCWPPLKVIMHMFRSALTWATRWRSNYVTDLFVQKLLLKKNFLPQLGIWPSLTSRAQSGEVRSILTHFSESAVQEQSSVFSRSPTYMFYRLWRISGEIWHFAEYGLW